MINTNRIQHINDLSKGAKVLLTALVEQGNAFAKKGRYTDKRYAVNFAQLDLDEAVEKSGLSGTVLLRAYGELIAGLYIEDNEGSVNLDPDYLTDAIAAGYRYKSLDAYLTQSFRRLETAMMREDLDEIELDLPSGIQTADAA